MQQSANDFQAKAATARAAATRAASRAAVVVVAAGKVPPTPIHHTTPDPTMLREEFIFL
jgi:hypothetical protein